MLLPQRGVNDLIDAIKDLPEANDANLGLHNLSLAKQRLVAACTAMNSEICRVVDGLEGDWTKEELRKVQAIGQSLVDRFSNLKI